MVIAGTLNPPQGIRVTLYDPNQSLGMKIINFIGFIAFGLCLVVSFSLALNFYLNLATTKLDLYMMFAVSIIQEIIKAYTITKGNFSWDFGFKKKARAYYLVYAFTLIASLISGLGSGLVIVDKKTSISASITYEDDIKNIEELISLDLQKIANKNEIILKRKEARDLLPADKLAEIEKIQKTIDITQREVDKINEEISSYRLQILDLKKKAQEENKSKEKTMYTLIADLFHWNITVITAGSFALLVIIVEAGMMVTSIHPNLGQIKQSKKKKEEEKEEEQDIPPPDHVYSPDPNEEKVVEETPVFEEAEEEILYEETPSISETLPPPSPIAEKKAPLINPYPLAPTNNGVKEEIPLIESVGGKLFSFPKREKGST